LFSFVEPEKGKKGRGKGGNRRRPRCRRACFRGKKVDDACGPPEITRVEELRGKGESGLDPRQFDENPVGAGEKKRKKGKVRPRPDRRLVARYSLEEKKRGKQGCLARFSTPVADKEKKERRGKSLEDPWLATPSQRQKGKKRRKKREEEGRVSTMLEFLFKKGCPSRPSPTKRREERRRRKKNGGKEFTRLLTPPISRSLSLISLS